MSLAIWKIEYQLQVDTICQNEVCHINVLHASAKRAVEHLKFLFQLRDRSKYRERDKSYPPKPMHLVFEKYPNSTLKVGKILKVTKLAESDT